jgi:hypothetical protein
LFSWKLLVSTAVLQARCASPSTTVRSPIAIDRAEP